MPPADDADAADDAVDRAEALLAAGRPEQAAAALAGRLPGRPDDARALTVLARCRKAQGDTAGALEAADAALRARPELSSAWVMRANALADLGRFAEAESAAQRVVELLPQNWAGPYTLGSVLTQADDRRRRKEAYGVALRAVELGPEESANHFLVGLAAHRTGDGETARRAYETALRLDPGYAAARYNLSLLHLRRSRLRRGRWAVAAEGFADAAALDVTDRAAPHLLEVMAWSIVAGARWVALLGALLAMIGTAGPRGGGPLLPAVPVTGVLLAALWTGWAWWVRRRVPRRLRATMLLLVRSRRPALAMACGMLLVAGFSVLAVALPRADVRVMGGIAVPAFWGMALTYWVARSALKKRAPGSG